MTSMTKDEALKLALEALEKSTKYFNIVRLGESRLKDTEIRGASHKAITAIKEALAQPDAFEQGPQEGMKQERALWELSKLGQEIEAQPEQKPTYEELDRIASELQDLCDRQALRLGAQSKQKPVAWCSQCGHKCPQIAQQEPVAWWDENLGVFDEKHFDQLQPLYTTPPVRPWVGLTEEEIEDCMEMSIQKTCRAIEAKLKEKNT